MWPTSFAGSTVITFFSVESIVTDRHVEHPDFVELYPGIVAEEAKEPMVPGVGITPTYTISRAVLSDAVGLVRGDRFYTVSRLVFVGSDF